MVVIHWQPWHELETLSRQVDELFNGFTAFDRPALATRRTEATWTPAVELKGNNTEFILRAELPGIAPKDLDIRVSQDAVSISGESRVEHQTEEKGLIRSEFRYGKFQRVIPLPAKVQNDQAKAEFKDGVLTLTLPHLQAVKPQVVKVQLTGETEADLSPSTPEATPASVSHNAEVNNAKSATDVTEDVWAA